MFFFVKSHYTLFNTCTCQYIRCVFCVIFCEIYELLPTAFCFFFAFSFVLFVVFHCIYMYAGLFFFFCYHKLVNTDLYIRSQCDSVKIGLNTFSVVSIRRLHCTHLWRLFPMVKFYHNYLYIHCLSSTESYMLHNY